MFAQTRLELVSLLATCTTNKTYSLAHLQELIPVLVVYKVIQCAAKVGVKSCRCARECVLLVVYVGRY